MQGVDETTSAVTRRPRGKEEEEPQRIISGKDSLSLRALEQRLERQSSICESLEQGERKQQPQERSETVATRWLLDAEERALAAEAEMADDERPAAAETQAVGSEELNAGVGRGASVVVPLPPTAEEKLVEVLEAHEVRRKEVAALEAKLKEADVAPVEVANEASEAERAATRLQALTRGSDGRDEARKAKEALPGASRNSWSPCARPPPPYEPTRLTPEQLRLVYAWLYNGER